MTAYQTIIRPAGPLTEAVLLGLLRDLGETPPARRRGPRRPRHSRSPKA